MNIFGNFLLATLLASTAVESQSQVLINSKENLGRRVKIFDWDDTIAYMPTKIILYSKQVNPQTGARSFTLISTNDFAIEGNNIGVTGKFADYEILENGDLNSFKFFRIDGTPDDEQSYFKNDIMAMLKGSPEEWKGPYFEQFIQMLSTKETSKNTYILTARGHSLQEVVLGLEYLQSYLQEKRNIKIHLLPKENILLVNAASDTPKVKGEQVVAIEKHYAKNSNIDTLEFADDDEKNTNAVAKAISENLCNLKRPVIVTHVSKSENKSLVFANNKYCQNIEPTDKLSATGT